MEKFHIVSAICRQVIKDGASKAVLSQMDRLYQALIDDGNDDEANLLKRLIYKADTTMMLEPSKVKEGANKRGNSSRLTQSFHFSCLSRFFLP